MSDLQHRLERLMPLPDGATADWNDVVVRAKVSSRLLSRSKKLLAASLALAAAASIAAVAYAIVQAQGPLTATQMTALESDRTVLHSVPASIRSDLGHPRSAPIHRLGHGTIAWRTHGGICWEGPNVVGRGPSPRFNLRGSSGGCVPEIPQPLDWTVAGPGPGQVDSRVPLRVFGLAVDSVTSVTVKLRDGRRRMEIPKDNFYVIAFPAGVPLEELETISATLKDGTVFTQPLPTANRRGIIYRTRKRDTRVRPAA